MKKNNLIEMSKYKNEVNEETPKVTPNRVIISGTDCMPNIEFINDNLNSTEENKIKALTNHLTTLTDNYINLLGLDDNMQYEVATKMATHYENIIALQVLSERDNYLKQISENIED